MCVSCSVCEIDDVTAVFPRITDGTGCPAPFPITIGDAIACSVHQSSISFEVGFRWRMNRVTDTDGPVKLRKQPVIVCDLFPA